ncbi:class II aldolase/adducin family protein [Shigella flexneri]
MQKLKQQVFEANMDLPRYVLVTFTWGNVERYRPRTRAGGDQASGVAYETMKADDMVVVDMSGKVVEGEYRPSSDTATHLELFRRYPSLGGIVHPTPLMPPHGRRRGWRSRRSAPRTLTTSLVISRVRVD